MKFFKNSSSNSNQNSTHKTGQFCRLSHNSSWFHPYFSKLPLVGHAGKIFCQINDCATNFATTLVPITHCETGGPEQHQGIVNNFRSSIYPGSCYYTDHNVLYKNLRKSQFSTSGDFSFLLGKNKSLFVILNVP